MQHIITFKTSKFDVSLEDENPYNPIYGQSLLIWLKETVASTIALPEPDTEDWGWYAYIDWKGRTYLIGSTAYYSEGDDPNAEIEWVFQVHKRRSFSEVLLGREKMTLEDGCLGFFKDLFESDPEFKDVIVEVVA